MTEIRPMRPLFAWVERKETGAFEVVDVAHIRVGFAASAEGSGFSATLVMPDSLVLAPGDKLRVDVKLPEALHRLPR